MAWRHFLHVSKAAAILLPLFLNFLYILFPQMLVRTTTRSLSIMTRTLGWLTFARSPRMGTERMVKSEKRRGSSSSPITCLTSVGSVQFVVLGSRSCPMAGISTNICASNDRWHLLKRVSDNCKHSPSFRPQPFKHLRISHQDAILKTDYTHDTWRKIPELVLSEVVG